jgi:hypothetical protein
MLLQQSTISEAKSPTDDTKVKNQATDVSQPLGEVEDVLCVEDSWKPFIITIQGVAS